MHRVYSLRRKRFRRRYGGVFIIDKSCRKVRKVIYNEGLHDAVFVESSLFSTEYFGGKIVKILLPTYRLEYLPNWLNLLYARVGQYSLESGEWVGGDIELSGYLGVYGIACLS